MVGLSGCPQLLCDVGVTDLCETYGITYVSNGADSGTVPVDGAEYQEGDIATVKGNTGGLGRSGYSFAGWNTASNGGGTSYSSGESLVMEFANITLYAKWSQDEEVTTYTVTYSPNGATSGLVPLESNDYEDGQRVTVLDNTGNLARTGHSFVGWNTLADGNGTTYTGGNTFEMGSANVTLYAKWSLNPTYTVTYNPNSASSGSVPTDSTSYENGMAVTVLSNTGNLARTGHSFVGWNTLADGNGSTYTSGNTFDMGSANVTLYAKWSANAYTVTYHANGGTGSMAQQSIVFGDTDSLTENAFTRSGYSFAGWATTSNGSVAYANRASYEIGAANVTLYAVWTPIVIFHSTYGNGYDGWTDNVLGNPVLKHIDREHPMMGGFDQDRALGYGKDAWTQYSLADLASGTYDISFDLYALDSWDNEWMILEISNDDGVSWNSLWNKRVYLHDNEGLLNERIGNYYGCWGGTCATDHLFDGDIRPNATFLHDGGSIKFRFKSTLNEPSWNESFGIDDIKLERVM